MGSVMFKRIHGTTLMASLALLLALLPAVADAQRRAPHRPPAPPPHGRAVVRAQVVFVGGYFYDPFFGPYPWWPPVGHPGRYYPVFDVRAVVRLQVKPREAAVYVDGFYAGIVNDFDGVFQGLPLPPGGHEIVIYQPGFRTVRHRLYLAPASHLDVHDVLQPLPPGAPSEPPPVAPPVPPPPDGTYIPPYTPPQGMPVPPPMPPPIREGSSTGYGSVSIRVQPPTSDVMVDGERWVSSEAGVFVIQVAAGPHRVEVSKSGYQTFSAEIAVRDGEVTPLNVSLSPR